MRYQNKRPKRQFIAGAVCQACGASDSTALIINYDDAGNSQEHISCVLCDFTEHRPTDAQILAIQQKNQQKIAENQKQASEMVQVVTFKP